MTISALYSLACTDCRASFFEPYSGGWTFEEADEAKDLAKDNGWEIDVEVPNGSLWDFCPRCISKRGDII